jgi:preprotein translocase subunit SecD
MAKNPKINKEEKTDESGQFTVHIKLKHEYCKILSDMAKKDRRTKTQMATVLLEIALEEKMKKQEKVE